MREWTFVARHRDRWSRLDGLLERAERNGLGDLSGKEISELAHLYRSVTSDLAIARGRGYGPELVETLNRAVAKAHALIYLDEAQSGRDRIVGFFVRELPHELRRSWKPIAFSTALTLLAAGLAFAAILRDPHLVYAILPEALIPAPIRKSLHDSNFAVSGSFAPAMSAFVITNNIRVAIDAFAGGMTGGLLTLYVLVSNGLFLGVLAGLFQRAGYGYDFWATIAPHGVIELPSIFISAAAGLIIGKALLLPGKLRRVDALVLAARRAAVLIVGVAALLVWAGVFEGFVSPRRIAPELRLAVGAVNALFFITYWGFAGRRDAATSVRPTLS